VYIYIYMYIYMYIYIYVYIYCIHIHMYIYIYNIYIYILNGGYGKLDYYPVNSWDISLANLMGSDSKEFFCFCLGVVSLIDTWKRGSCCLIQRLIKQQMVTGSQPAWYPKTIEDIWPSSIFKNSTWNLKQSPKNGCLRKQQLFMWKKYGHFHYLCELDQVAWPLMGQMMHVRTLVPRWTLLKTSASSQ